MVIFACNAIVTHSKNKIMKSTFDTRFGTVTLRTVMIDDETGNGISEAIEVTVDNKFAGTIHGSYFDFQDEDIEISDIEDFIDHNDYNLDL